MEMITKIGASEQYPKTTGQIRVALRDLLMEKSITRFRLHTLTGIKYEVIDRYYRSENVIRVDLPLLAEICDALNCDISDILKYERLTIRSQPPKRMVVTKKDDSKRV